MNKVRRSGNIFWEELLGPEGRKVRDNLKDPRRRNVMLARGIRNTARATRHTLGSMSQHLGTQVALGMGQGVAAVTKTKTIEYIADKLLREER